MGGGNKEEIFIPYRENMQFPLGPNRTITFTGVDSESALYYEKQATDKIKVTIKSEEESSGNSSLDGDINIKLPLEITITNNSNFTVGYIPYKQNFEEYLGSGESQTLTIEKAEEAMYYILQKNNDLSVKVAGDEPSGGLTWLINEKPDINVETFLNTSITGKVNPLTANETYGDPIKMYMIGVQKGNTFVMGINSEGYGGVVYGNMSGGSEKSWQFITAESTQYTVKDTTKLRTVTFDTAPTGELLTWLKANAKQV